MSKIIRPYKIGIKELVPLNLYTMLKEEAWRLFDDRLLITLDTLRRFFGYTIILNTWSFSKKARDKYSSFSYRGHRPFNCGVGSKTGAHYRGLAIDVDFYSRSRKIPSDKMIELILDNIQEFPYIRGIELNVNWNHIDCMGEEDSKRRAGIVEGKVLLFDPKNGSNNKLFTV